MIIKKNSFRKQNQNKNKFQSIIGTLLTRKEPTVVSISDAENESWFIIFYLGHKVSIALCLTIIEGKLFFIKI